MIKLAIGVGKVIEMCNGRLTHAATFQSGVEQRSHRFA
jgi:hypothetical protein